MTELYLVRHGQTEENAAHILQGHMPGHLSHEGIAQAQALRDELKNIRFDALLCSDLKRCMDTAMILNEPHGLPLESTSPSRTGLGTVHGYGYPEGTYKDRPPGRTRRIHVSPGGNIPARYSVPLQR